MRTNGWESPGKGLTHKCFALPPDEGYLGNRNKFLLAHSSGDSSSRLCEPISLSGPLLKVVRYGGSMCYTECPLPKARAHWNHSKDIVKNDLAAVPSHQGHESQGQGIF